MIEVFCYVAIPGNKPGKRIGIVEHGESGYYETDLDYAPLTPGEVKEDVDRLNRKLAIPEDVAESMLWGSMFGWSAPAAMRANEWAANQRAANQRTKGEKAAW